VAEAILDGGGGDQFDWLGWAGLAVAIFAAIGPFVVLPFFRSEFRAKRADLLSDYGKANRREAAEALERQLLSEKYTRALGSGLSWLERVYEAPCSRYALLLSILIAYAYSWFLFFALWGTGLVPGEW
jgi:hypothetical protein